MLPAANKGVGMNMGFPDVCLTPAVPAPVPIPYPNMAMNAMAVPFCPTILLTMMPALNMGSIIPMTLGDQPGVANPLFMQMGMYTMGNPTITLQALPAINLTCPTSGNMMNNPVGAVLVPSATNVMFALAGARGAAGHGGKGQDGEEPGEAASEGFGTDALAELGERLAVSAEATAAAVQASQLAGGVGYVAVRLFTAAVPSAFHDAVRRLAEAGMESLVVDLRGNPGGEVDAAVALAGDFLPAGRVVVTLIDGDGDEAVFRTQREGSYSWPLAVLVDRTTASAAELFAGCLQAHGRARLWGEATHGKGVAQAALPSLDGGLSFATVARFVLPDGSLVQGAGLTPDVRLPRKGMAAHPVGWPAAEPR